MKRKGKAKQHVSDVERERTGKKKRSIAEAFDELRRIRGDEPPFEAAPRRNRPNEFIS